MQKEIVAQNKEKKEADAAAAKAEKPPAGAETSVETSTVDADALTAAVDRQDKKD